MTKDETPDVTGAPNDPSSGDLPKEGSTSGSSSGPIQEERK
nr:hypothetical protein [Planococcus glaciei]